MENKLQELTQKLYNEGLSKGQQEATQIVTDAKKEAQNIIDSAKKEAEAILKTAKQNSEDIKKNTNTELSLAARQTIGELKQRIEKMIILKGISPAVNAANDDPEFVKQLLLNVATSWNGGSSSKIDLTAVLPADQQAKFQTILSDSAKASLTNGLEITFDNKVKSGFKIGPKDGSFYISFSNEDFDALLKEYLRPQVTKILFEE